MKNSTYQTLKILILSIMAITLIGILVLLLLDDERNHFNWSFKKNPIIIYEQTYSNLIVDEIKVDVNFSDITIKHSDTNETRIVIYGEKGEQSTSQVESNRLIISKEEKSELCFGLCFANNNEIILYIPKEIDTTFQLRTGSGDIWIDDFKNSKLNVQTSSGDIEVERAKTINGKSQSGDIEINSIEQAILSTSSGSMELDDIKGLIHLETNSGDIEIENLQILENSNIYTSSGDVSISNINDCYIQVKTRSGDINMRESNRFSEFELKIETNSGDISVR